MDVNLFSADDDSLDQALRDRLTLLKREPLKIVADGRFARSADNEPSSFTVSAGNCVCAICRFLGGLRPVKFVPSGFAVRVVRIIRPRRKNSTGMTSAAPTKAYDQWLLLSLIGSTAADVARKERLTYNRVEGALERLLESEVNGDEVRALEILERDEIALKKGPRDFVVPVTTRTPDGELKLLALLPNRQRETVEAFLRQVPAR